MPMNETPQRVSVSEAFTRAMTLEKGGDLDGAADIYRSILSRETTHRRSYINLGSLYSRKGELQNAVRCFQKALALAPDYMAHYNLGCVYYKMSQFKKAVIHLEKSRALHGDFINAPLLMGLCYSKLKNMKAAEMNFLEVLRSDPAQRIATTALAILYHNQKRHNDAMELLERLTEKDRGSAAVLEIKSEIFYETGRIDESAREIKSLRKISDGYTYYDTYISAIPVEVFTDKYGTLEDKIETLQGRDDSDSQNLISLSLCYLLKGDSDKAIDLLFQVKKHTFQ